MRLAQVGCLLGCLSLSSLAGGQPPTGSPRDFGPSQPPGVGTPDGPAVVDGPWPLPSEIQQRWRVPEQPAAAGQAVMPALPFRLPADFEPHEALLLAANELATHYPQLFISLVRAATTRTQVLVLVDGMEDRQLVAGLLQHHHLPPDSVTCVDALHDTMWLRDYGPLFVVDGLQGRTIIDADYLHLGRPRDDQVPLALGGPLRLHVVRAPLELEGGNLLSNGQGLLLTTTSTLELNRLLGRRAEEVERGLQNYLGVEQIVLLEPLNGEQTGHVDMFAAFTAADAVVVGAYDPAEDPVNAELLDRNAFRLSQVITRHGPLQVVRVPMPPHADGIFRSYTNAVFLNGALLLPAYGHAWPEHQQQAATTFRQLLPGWEIVEVDVTSIAQLGGALHCICMTVPWAPARSHLPIRRPYRHSS